MLEKFASTLEKIILQHKILNTSIKMISMYIKEIKIKLQNYEKESWVNLCILLCGGFLSRIPNTKAIKNSKIKNEDID